MEKHQISSGDGCAARETALPSEVERALLMDACDACSKPMLETTQIFFSLHLL